MKIGVLTLPLQNNYGGLLQAYALKEVLQSLGHEVIIINREKKKPSSWRKYASIAKSVLIGREIAPNILLSVSQKEKITKETRNFKDKYIPNLSHLITDNNGMQDINKMSFDAYVVGSDQCWRPRYSPSIRNYFLDFAAEDKIVKRIAYAASFGVSHLEFTNEDTIACKELLQKFDAISVREDSAIDLIKTNFGRKDVHHVLDPTMLLSTNTYKEITDRENISPSRGTLKVYVLDKTPEKDKLVRQIGDKLHLESFEVLPVKRLNEKKVTKDNIEDFVYPNPAEWLRGFQDAEFVVTDSFHGTVFAILHNIPFIAIGNKNRGLSRFESLLSMFGLNDRLVTDFAPFDVDDYLSMTINWTNVNIKLNIEREKAIKFIADNL